MGLGVLLWGCDLGLALGSRNTFLFVRQIADLLLIKAVMIFLVQELSMSTCSVMSSDVSGAREQGSK